MIRSARLSDAEAICTIYNPYIVQTTISFEETPVSIEEMEGRIAEVTQKYSWIVYEENQKILGYAYASPWRVRASYRHSVELAIYLDQNQRGKGIGKALYLDLTAKLTTLNVHALIGGITLPNPESVALHEKLGFQKVAHFKEVGHKFGSWHDVGYWEKII